jgi:hypothetical protein
MASSSTPIFDKDAPKAPKFNVISRVTGSGLVKAVLTSCYTNAPAIVPLFSGIMPREMLEYSMPLHKSGMIARRAGCYKNAAGALVQVNQLADTYRRSLIDAAIIKFPECKDETEILELLFPKAGVQSRDRVRANIELQTQTVLQKMMQLYPSEEIALQMSLDDDLQAAMVCNDLIAWLIAFEKFCLSNEGNKSSNVAAAEDALKKTKLKASKR